MRAPQNKKVEGNAEGFAEVRKERTWRQYMNRVGGECLSASQTSPHVSRLHLQASTGRSTISSDRCIECVWSAGNDSMSTSELADV
jgi:hypothetical protein